MNKRSNKNNSKAEIDFFGSPDDTAIKAERAKARDLRHSAWWQNKLNAGVCYYCEKIFARDELTMDHVVPIARGGKSTKNNIVCCCKECNNQKKQNLPNSWDF